MTSGTTTFGALLDRQAARHGDKPFLTWYDDETNARVELSFKTLRNWVGKVANLLTDELGLEPGDRVAIAGGQHWQTVAVMLGCWRAGLPAMVLAPDAAPASDEHTGGPRTPLAAALDASSRAGVRARFVREEWLDQLPGAGPATVVGLGSGPFGTSSGRLGDAPDFGRLAAAMPDDFGGADAAAGADALVGTSPGLPLLTFANLLAGASAGTAALGLDATARMATLRPLADPSAVATGVLAPLLAGTGTVISTGVPSGRLWTRLRAERVVLAEVPVALLPAVLREPPGGAPGPPVVLAGHGSVPLGLARRWLTGTDAPLLHGFCLPETSGYACLLERPVSEATLQAAGQALPVGPPVAGLELLVAGPDGTAASEGMPGELCVRGPAVVTRWADPAAAPTAVRDGWLATGWEGRLVRPAGGSPSGRRQVELTGRHLRAPGLPYTPAS